MRINAQLIEGATGGHLWADRYDRDLTDIFAIQDEITKTIVEQLKVKLLPEEKKAIEQAPTENVEAYTHYLKGREFFHTGKQSHPTRWPRQMFAKAIELDPLYARAYAGIADCDLFLYLDYSEGSSLDGILANCARALELDSTLAEARASRGLALSASQKYREAAEEFEFGDSEQPKPVRSPLLLCALLLRPGQACRGGHALGACGRDQARRLSVGISTGASLSLSRTVEG